MIMLLMSKFVQKNTHIVITVRRLDIQYKIATSFTPYEQWSQNKGGDDQSTNNVKPCSFCDTSIDDNHVPNDTPLFDDSNIEEKHRKISYERDIMRKFQPKHHEIKTTRLLMF